MSQTRIPRYTPPNFSSFYVLILKLTDAIAPSFISIIVRGDGTPRTIIRGVDAGVILMSMVNVRENTVGITSSASCCCYYKCEIKKLTFALHFAFHYLISTPPNQCRQNAENVQILHKYQRNTSVLCVQHIQKSER